MTTKLRGAFFDVLFLAYAIITVGWVAALPFNSWRPDKEEIVLRMPQVAAVALGAIVLAGVIVALGGIFRLGPPPGRFWRAHVWLTLFATLVISVRLTDSSLAELLDADGIRGAGRLWSGLAHPNWALLPKVIVEAVETIFIAFLATSLAIPFAFLFAFAAAKNLMRGSLAVIVYAALRTGMNLSRSVEPLIWALIFTVWVGVGPFAGMLALMIHSIASLTKYYSEILENVDEGPLDGVRATGARPLQVIWYGVLPQVLLPYIAMTVYRWDTNVRMATVIGLVGGGGIGTLLIQYQGQAMWPEVGCIVLVIAAIVWLMDFASGQIREALK